MTENNDDERDPDSIYIGERLACIAFMVLRAFTIRPWEDLDLFRLLFSVFWFGINTRWFICPWKFREDGADY